jgi:hypothetical protein
MVRPTRGWRDAGYVFRVLRAVYGARGWRLSPLQ